MRVGSSNGSVAVVFNLVTVGVGNVKSRIAAAALDGDALLVEFSLHASQSRGADFETDVFQALIAG